MFWKEAPKEGESNEFVDALTALKYDDTKENIAEGCNTTGNNILKKGIEEVYF